jgi:hypothetical protein
MSGSDANTISVMEDTMIKPFATLISCRDTIDSECPRGLSLQDCVQRCQDDPLCACGYYLEPAFNKEPSYCAPLNASLLKNMNLMLNIYPHNTDPTKELWQRTAVFYRPLVYPVKNPDNYVLMQKDICSLAYVLKGVSYYFQADLSWQSDMVESAQKILFIDKFPQFYELANNIQSHATFIMKFFGQPQVLSVSKNKIAMVPYMTVSGTADVADLYMYIPDTDKTDSVLKYPILMLDSPFQILTNNMTSYLGPISKPKDGVVKLDVLPYTGDDSVFKGHFVVSRLNIQPNIYKVAEMLPAHTSFIKNSVSPIDDSQRQKRITTIVLVVSLVILLLVILLLLFYSPFST